MVRIRPSEILSAPGAVGSRAAISLPGRRRAAAGAGAARGEGWAVGAMSPYPQIARLTSPLHLLIALRIRRDTVVASVVTLAARGPRAGARCDRARALLPAPAALPAVLATRLSLRWRSRRAVNSETWGLGFIPLFDTVTVCVRPYRADWAMRGGWRGVVSWPAAVAARG